MLDQILFAAADNAYEAGGNIGRVVGILLALAGFIKCVQIAGRPKTSTTCVVSLMLFCLAWLVNAVFQFVNGQAELGGTAVSAMAILSLILFAASLVLGIVGLVELSINEGKYNQGKAQAGWGIALSILGLLLMAGGAVSAINEGSSPDSPLAASLARKGKFDTFSELNFRFSKPGSPYVNLNAQRFNPAANVCYMRMRPQVVFMIIAERVGVESTYDNEGLAEVSKAYLESAGGNTKIESSVAETIDGIRGLRFHSETDVTPGQRLAYSHWVCGHNGFLYQLVTFGEAADARLVQNEAKRLCRGFELIDRRLVAHTPGYEPLADFASRDFGYSVKLDGSGWLAWPNLDDDFPEAHLGAQYSTYAGFCVVPLRLDFAKPNDQALLRGLLYTMDMTYPSDALENLRPHQQSGAEGFAMESSRENNGTNYLYRLRVVRNENFAYLLAAWIDAASKSEIRRLDEILDKVSFSADPAEPVQIELTEGQRLGRADMLNEIGLAAFANKQYARAAEYFELAFNEFSNSATMLTNRLDALTQIARHEEALEFLEKHLSHFEGNLEVESWHAFLKMKTGDPDAARDIYARIFQAGYNGENDLLDYVNLLIEVDQYDTALAVLSAFIQRQPSPRVKRWQASVHSQKGDHLTAVKLLQELQAGLPFDAQIAYELAEIHDEAEQHAEALAVCQQLMDHGFETAYAYQLKGRNEYSLKWYRKAKASFEQSLKIDPQDENAKDYLQHISGLLGQGENSSIKEKIEPVEIPPAVVRAIEAADDTVVGLRDGYGARYDRRVTGIAYRKNKKMRTTYFRKVTVHTISGVKSNSTIEFSFDPLAERIFVNELTVKDTDGRVVAEGNVDDYYVIDDNSSGMATHDKLLHVPVPGLKPGFSVQYTVTREDYAPADFFPYTENFFSSGYPTRSSAFFISGDVDGLKHRGTTAGDPATSQDVMYWILTDPAVLRWEPMQQQYARYVPTVWVSDGGLDWQSIAQKYLEDIEDKLALDDRTRELSAKLTDGLISVSEKVTALARHVQSEYTYKAIEFGRRSRIPNTSVRTIQNKYGDCKDHSLLLHQLLRAAGIKSHLALISTDGPAQPDLPSMDQFNHMIVFVEELGGGDAAANTGGGRFIDCTDKNTDALPKTPLELDDELALVLDPDNPRLVRTPQYEPDSSVVESKRTVMIDAESPESDQRDARVDETLIFTGIYAGGIRGYLKAIEPAERRSSVQEIMTAYGKIRLRELDVANLDDTAAPLVMKMKYVVKEAFRADGDRLVGTLPSPWEREYLSATYVEDRRTPFQIKVPLVFRSEVEMELPPRFGLTAAAALNHQAETDFFGWKLAATQDDATARFSFEFQRPNGRYDAARYADYYEAMERMLGGLTQELVLTRLGPADK